MDETKKSFQPWNLILILVCVAGFVGGIYLLNFATNSRFDAVDASLTGSLSKTSIVLDRIDGKLSEIQAKMEAMETKMATPPPPPPAPVDPAAAAAVPAPAHAPKPAPAKAE